MNFQPADSAHESKPSFGLGMDLPWDDPKILDSLSGRPAKDFRLFLNRYSDLFDYSFVSLQPKRFDLLTNRQAIEDYYRLFDEVLPLLPNKHPPALHHTFLNMGSLETDYPREKVVEFTNALIHRYGLRWVNEDLGIWSLKKKTLPYPLPPVLNSSGLRASIANVRYYKENLACPLFVEFPGFSEGASFTIGRMNAFDFFKTVILETGADCVLDTGHILSYQWLLGNTGERMLEGLEDSLPLANCREIHLSGCSIVGERFIDFHHGVIQDEQLLLLDFLLARCPHLVGVTYEDPKFDSEGHLIPKAIKNFDRLREQMRRPHA